MSGIREAEVLDALSGVRDPELDEPITTLGFVSHVEREGATVRIRLRLPTYFCSPNFAYIMAEDAKRALLSLPRVRRAEVTLEDFHVAEEINRGVQRDEGFDRAMASFSDETTGEDLDAVRETFRRKAFVRRQEILCRTLLARGNSPRELAHMRLGEVPPCPELEVYLQRRRELGFDLSPTSPLLLSAGGDPIPEAAVVEHLRKARLTRISLEGNGALCSDLLAARYGRKEKSSV
ncbi:hypothetical protein Rxycam_00905 [Rubrobacter xylanophilus DSM 9941]|uniref:iron-sulfur cluster assembly protein n=1 Tax=Rubrobacter xylanophilus TaxID=49319 RepID=UPI001C63C672|nr:iron-sulfur cluster assembly protein [Rubrobacter xylanophilus]QYJ15093.1 hypothetical protein Rxycam_00905 [Rubrobacter xylanophilus DSM 9941]